MDCGESSPTVPTCVNFASMDGLADVYALAEAEGGDLWVGTCGAGTLSAARGWNVSCAAIGRMPIRPRTGSTTMRFAPCSPTATEISGLPETVAGWPASTRRRARSATTSHDPARANHGMSGNRLAALLRGRDGELFVGSWANGFSVQNPRTEVFTHVESIAGDPRTLPTRLALTVWGEPDGTLWVGVLEGGGLVHLDPQKGVIARFTHDPARPDSLVPRFRPVHHPYPRRQPLDCDHERRPRSLAPRQFLVRALPP